MKEVLWPFMYIFLREHYRVKTSKKTSIIRMKSSMILNYFWVPIFALIITNTYLDTHTYLKMAIYVITFFLIYETGYLVSDNLSVKNETPGIKREFYYTTTKLVLAGILIRIFLLFAAFKYLEQIFTYEIKFLYIITLLVFILHSILKEHQRIGTFVMLRVLKGYVPYAFLLMTLNQTTNFIILIGLAGSAIFFTIEYASRKWKGNIEMNFYDIKSNITETTIMIILVMTTSLIFSVDYITTIILISSIIVTKAGFALIKYIYRKIRKK